MHEQEHRTDRTDRDGRASDTGAEATEVRVWMVERVVSADNPNVIDVTYATTDGERYRRKEIAHAGFNDVREVTAAVDLAPDDLAPVDDEETRDRYAAEATRMAERHDPGDVI